MAKRSSRAAPSPLREGKVEPLFGPGWHPLGVERDLAREQSYLRKVRPQSDNQRVLMAAIERHSLTLALGPDESIWESLPASHLALPENAPCSSLPEPARAEFRSQPTG